MADTTSTAPSPPELPPQEFAPSQLQQSENLSAKAPASRIAPVVALAIGLLALAPILGGDFVYDDIEYLARNPALYETPAANVLFTSEYFAASRELSYRPFVTATYLLDHAVYGLKPIGWRATNLIVHLGCALSLFYLIRQFGAALWAAAVASMLFAVHPLRVEAVASAGFREDPLAALGVLGAALALGAWRIGPSPRSWRLPAIGATSVFLAQMSKENALMAPVLLCSLALCDPWRSAAESQTAAPRRPRSAALPFLIAIGAATALAVLLRFVIFADGGEPAGGAAYVPPFSVRIRHAVWMLLAHGIKPVFWPVNLYIAKQIDFTGISAVVSIGGWLVLAAYLAALAKLIKRSPRLASGLVWHIVAWLPTMNIAPILNPAADRYTYMPDLGLAMSLGIGLDLLARKASAGGGARAVANASVAAVAFAYILFSAITFRLGLIWQDNDQLWERSLAYQPDSVAANTQAGLIKFREYMLENDRGRNADARQALERSVAYFDRALYMAPTHQQLLVNYAACMAEAGQYDKARHLAQTALQLNPANARARAIVDGLADAHTR